MAKRCSICGDKIAGFFFNGITLSDGYIGKKCYSKIGISKNYAGNTWAEIHSVADVKSLIGQHKTVDAKDEMKQKKVNDKAEYDAIVQRYKEHNAKVSDRMHADFVDKRIYLAKTLFYPYYEFPFSDVIGFTPIKNGVHESKHHRITRGVVGGALAGGVGAVIGASTGGQEYEAITDLGIDLNFADGSSKRIQYLTTKEKEKSVSARAALTNYQHGISILTSVMATNQND